MIAEHVRKEAEAILGKTNEDEYVLRKLSDAIEMLANEGNWDGMTGYVRLNVNNQPFMMLPSEIETPLFLYQDDGVDAQQRALFRDRLYEFIANHPAETLRNKISFEWGDTGEFPLQIIPDTDTRLRVNNIGAKVKVTGYTSDDRFAEGITLQDVYTDSPIWKANSIVSISREKGAPNTFVKVFAETGSGLTPPAYAADGIVSTIAWDDLEPKYRRVTFGKPVLFARMIYRRRTRRIQCWSSYIPIDNKLSLTFALRSIRLLELTDPKIEAGSALQKFAVDLLNKEQVSRNSAQALAAAGALNISDANANLNMTGLISVSEIYDAACSITGPVGKEKVLDFISATVKRLSDKAGWDSLLGFADARAIPAQASRDLTYQGGMVLALPGWIDSIISMSDCRGNPLVGRNEFVHFHLNGPSPTHLAQRWYDWMPDSALMRDLAEDCNLIAIKDNDGDPDPGFRIYGRNADGHQVNGTDGQPGVAFNGQPTTTTAADIDPNADQFNPLKKFKKVDRIIRTRGTATTRFYILDLTVTGIPGFRLLAIMEPEAKESLYRRARIKIQCGFVDAGTSTGTVEVPAPPPENPIETAPCFRIMFRRRSPRFSRLSEPIFLRSADAVEMAMKARAAGDDDALEAAAKVLHEELRARQPGDGLNVQYLDPLIETFSYVPI